MADVPKAQELVQINHSPSIFDKGWMNTPTVIREGIACYAGKPKDLEYVGLPNPREWNPLDVSSPKR